MPERIECPKWLAITATPTIRPAIASSGPVFPLAG
jgi:hypothetical protein